MLVDSLSDGRPAAIAVPAVNTNATTAEENFFITRNTLVTVQKKTDMVNKLLRRGRSADITDPKTTAVAPLGQDRRVGCAKAQILVAFVKNIEPGGAILFGTARALEARGVQMACCKIWQAAQIARIRTVLE
jgi:hypothetical protein